MTVQQLLGIQVSQVDHLHFIGKGRIGHVNPIGHFQWFTADIKHDLLRYGAILLPRIGQVVQHPQNQFCFVITVEFYVEQQAFG